MSYTIKKEIIIICDRCNICRKFDANKLEEIEEFIVSRLGWDKKEDEIDNKIKHYCPNCKEQIEMIIESQNKEEKVKEKEEEGE